MVLITEVISLIVASILLVILLIVGPTYNFNKLIPKVFRKTEQSGKTNKEY